MSDASSPLWQRLVRPRHDDESAPMAAPPPTSPRDEQSLLVRFRNARLVTESGIRMGELWMQAGKIVDPQTLFWERREGLVEAESAADRCIDCQGMILAPGMIDIMLYGAFGVDFSMLGGEGNKAAHEATQAMQRVCARLPELGITAFCPAIRPCAPDVCVRILERLAPPPSKKQQSPSGGLKRRAGAGGGDGGATGVGAQVLGAHLDGPYISKERAPDEAARSFARETFDGADDLRAAIGFGAGAERRIALMTVAPELPGAVDAIRALSASGVVVGLGRTAAELSHCETAVAAGARLITHVFSHMPPFKHRDPGPIGLLAEREAAAGAEGDAAERIFFSMAVAGQHEATVNLAQSTHPEGLVLLSSSHAVGDGEGEGGAPHGTEGMAAAGILQSARRLWQCSGTADPSAALLCGSAHPAELLKQTAKGSLDAGADADLVLLDPTSLDVRACYVGGRLSWADPNLNGAMWYHA